VDPLLRKDLRDFSVLLAEVAELSAAYLEGIDDEPVVGSPGAPGNPGLRDLGEGAASTVKRFQKTVLPGLAAASGPRYLGFVTGGGTPAAVVGDWLATILDQNAVSTLDATTALALEAETLDMLRRLLGLPPEFSGVFVTGATMANFVGLSLAREWAGRSCGVRVNDQGIAAAAAPAVFAGSAHSSVGKALSMLGLGRSALRPVPLVPGREAMDTSRLSEMLAEQTRPCVVVGSAGTVNTGDFDDFATVAGLPDADDSWLHIDAAFGAFAALSPATASLLAGWERADSICVDLHKWLNVPYDSAVCFTRHRDLQLDVFHNDADYLGRPGQDPAPIHLAPENSHRWRALPAWFSLTAYGASGHREIVERNCRLARDLGERIDRSAAYELLSPVRLNIVCFTPTTSHGDRESPEARVKAVVDAVRHDGRTFVTPTVLAGRPAIRAAFSNWRTTGSDLELIWSALSAAAG
jgi:glutamate/tyrosine decarboxylase-like PLP-dependent enzyme